MPPLPRIGVLVEVRAVEFRQAVRVRREMRRHPVQNHADPVLWQRSTKYMKSSGVP